MSRSLNNPYVLVQEGLKVLPKRTKDVIMRRFGVNQNERETLESIGRHYGITRERVRQIEDDGLKRLKKEEVMILFKPIVSKLESYLRSHGDLRREDSFLRDATSLYFPKIQGGRDVKQCPQAITLILTISEPFNYFGETDKFYPLWTLNKQSVDQAGEIMENLEKYFEANNNTIVEEDINSWFANQDSRLSEEARFSYLDVSKMIEKNLFNEYGLVHWPTVTPRGVRDRAYLVFKRKNAPLHFTDVAKLINELGISQKKAYAQTVHNELIKDERFVLVGRGLYALTEWGYKPGTVKDVIRDILLEMNRPMSKQEIVDEVLKRRIVKTNTISLNIQNSPEFEKMENDAYILKS
jgi:hypothetical protein